MLKLAIIPKLNKFIIKRDEITLDKVILSKFGEYTVADPNRIRRAAEIVKANPSRRYVMTVAPGRQKSEDTKVTDLLCIAHTRSTNGENYAEILALVQERFTQIIKDLGIDFDIEAEIADLKKNLFFRKNLDYVASRGEYIMSKILAKFLGWEFVDAAKLIFFDKDGTLNTEKSLSTASAMLKNVERAVIPGFYGSINGTQIKTFAREDCDTSAALIATAVNADLLERWTEPKRTYVVNPSIIKNPLALRYLTYGELNDLTYMGVNVINDLALFQLTKAGITMSVRMIDNPDDPGMLVTKELTPEMARNVVSCIAGKKDYKVLYVKKYGLNKMPDFIPKLLGVFAKRNIACEHCITGIHQVSLLIKNLMFDLRREEIFSEIKKAVSPDSLVVENDISLLAVIGQGLRRSQVTLNKIFNALSEAKIESHIMDQGCDDVSVILGVRDEDYEKAIKVLYDAVIEKRGE